MAKNNKTIQKKSKTTKVNNKPAAAPEEAVIVETVEQSTESKPQDKVNPSQINVKNLTGNTNSKLDANHRVDLLGLADDIFRKDPNAENRFSVEVREGMNSIIAAGVIAAISDEAVYGDSTFSAILNHTMYPQLVVVAKDMGVTLPNIKSLDVKNDGTVEVSASQVKVSKTAKEQIVEEHAIEDEKPELDPVKVAAMSEDDLKKALQYLLIVGPKKSNIKQTLTSVVDFMRTYRMTLADKAENAAEAKLKFDDYTVDQWLMDAFTYVKPTFLLHGIGRGLITMASLDKSPISSFCILRKSLTDPETKQPVWDDQSIADATKAIIYLVASNCINDEQKNLDALDKKAKDYKEASKKYQDSIQHYKDILGYVSNPDPEIITSLVEKMDKDKDPVAIKIYGRIKDQYYPEKARGGFKNIDYNITQLAGIICNMFKPIADRDTDYSTSNLHDLVAYTTEEIKEMREAEVKAAAEAKKEESKNA